MPDWQLPIISAQYIDLYPLYKKYMLEIKKVNASQLDDSRKDSKSLYFLIWCLQEIPYPEKLMSEIYETYADHLKKPYIVSIPHPDKQQIRIRL